MALCLREKLVFVTTQPKNWKAFSNACIHDPVIEQIRFLYDAISERDDVLVLFVTARGENDRPVTEAWLEKHGFRYEALIMRPDGDHRKDYVVKADLLAFIRETYGEPFMIFDDRPDVISMYRQAGVFVLDVNHDPEIATQHFTKE